MQNDVIAKMLEEPGVEKGKMFGWECLKIGGNVFMAWNNDASLAFKIASEEMEQALGQPGITEHDHGNPGMPMKQWIFSTEPKSWYTFADLALAYCSTLPPKKAKK